MKVFLRYLISIVLLGAGLLLLNCAAFRSWASWGPPTKFPEAWADGARFCFGYGLALMLLAIAAFVGIGRFNAGRRVPIRSFPFLLVLLAALTAAAPYVYRFFSVDQCLDAGGRWNYEISRCEH